MSNVMHYVKRNLAIALDMPDASQSTQGLTGAERTIFVTKTSQGRIIDRGSDALIAPAGAAGAYFTGGSHLAPAKGLIVSHAKQRPYWGGCVFR